jgi:Plasmid recombination enzyme
MSYCIIRFEKIKTTKHLSDFAAHNFRFHLTKGSKERIDIKRSLSNRVLLNKLEVKKTTDLSKNLTQFYKDLDIKPRADSVLGIDLLTTTSPEFWGDWKDNPTPEFNAKLDAWVKTQMDFIIERFGVDNVQAAILHLDEQTPHIHFLITPQESKVVTFKNRHGSVNKEKNILNAKKWDPEFYLDLVDRFAVANVGYGLIRGERGSEAQHKPLNEYKTELIKETTLQKQMQKTYITAIEADKVHKKIIIELSKENNSLQRKLALLEAQKHLKENYVTPEDLDSLGL